MTRSDVNYTIFREPICWPLKTWYCPLNSTAVVPSEGTTCPSLLSSLDLNDSDTVAWIAHCIWSFHGCFYGMLLRQSDWKRSTNPRKFDGRRIDSKICVCDKTEWSSGREALNEVFKQACKEIIAFKIFRSFLNIFYSKISLTDSNHLILSVKGYVR